MNEETGGTYQGTDFKQYPHEQLLQMFTRENFQQVGDAAARLAELSGRMTAAAVRLRRYTESLGPEDWDGDARLSFDQWTQGLINTTFTVADGVGEIGEAVQVVADKMAATNLPQINQQDKQFITQMTSVEASTALAQAGPMFPDGGASLHTDIDAANARLNKDHDEAVTLMQALSATYSAQADRINRVQMPEYGPPPNMLGVGDPIGDLGFRAAGSGGGSTVTGAGSSSPAYKKASGSTSGPQSAATSGPATAVPVPSIAVGQPMAGADGTPGTGAGGSVAAWSPPADSQLAGTSALSAVDQNALPAGPSSIDSRTTGGPGDPTNVGPMVGRPPGPGIAGGTTGFSGPGTVKGGGPRSGGLPVTGPNTARPSGGSTGARELTTRPGGPPRGSSNGVVGGMPTSGHGSGGRMPTTGAAGRTAGGTPGAPGRAGGRLSTGQPGGVVGGRANTPPSQRSFSPGGSGLGRPGHAMRGGAGAAADADAERRRRERAEYLEEDEETWDAQGRPSVPPVID